MYKIYIFLVLLTGVTKQNCVYYTVPLNCIYDCVYVFLSFTKTQQALGTEVSA